MASALILPYCASDSCTVRVLPVTTTVGRLRQPRPSAVKSAAAEFCPVRVLRSRLSATGAPSKTLYNALLV